MSDRANLHEPREHEYLDYIRNKRLFSHLILKFFFSLVGGLFVTWISTQLIANLTSTSKLEYRIEVDRIKDWLPSNLAQISKVVGTDGTELTEGSVVTISFWNRTSKNIGPATIDISDSQRTKAFHKVILWGDGLNKEWVNWSKPGDPSDYQFRSEIMVKNWSEHPNLKVRLFFIGSSVKETDFKISTSSPEVGFEGFDKEKYYWWLFGLDGPAIALGSVIVLSVIFWILNMCSDALYRKTLHNHCVGYGRVLIQNFPNLDRATTLRLIKLYMYVHIFSQQKFIWRKADDFNYKMPEDDASSEPESQ